MINFTKRLVFEWRILVGLGTWRGLQRSGGLVRPLPSPAAAWAPLQGLGHWAGCLEALPAAALIFP